MRKGTFSKKTITVRIPQLLAGLAAFVLAAELAARVDDWYKYDANPLAPYSREGLEGADDFGIRGKPHARFEKWRLNNLGFRGADVGLKMAGRPRVVVMGSSETFGLYESEGSDWPSQLRDDLLANGVNAEIVNAAFYGFSLQLNLNQLEHRVLPLKPDLVVLYLDLYSNYYLKGTRASRWWPKKHRALEWRLGRKVWSALQSLAPPPLYAAYLRAIVVRERRSHQLSVYDRLPPEAHTRIRDDLQRFIDLCRQRGVRLILASHVCRTDELALLMRQRDRAALSLEAIAETHERLNALLAATARANHLSFVDLAAAVPATPKLVVDASHFSNEGARLVADKLLPAVMRELSGASAGQ